MDRDQLAVMCEKITQSRFDIGIAECANRSIDGQSVPLRHVELGELPD